MRSKTKRPPVAHGLTAQDIRNVMRTEFDHYLSDIEYRVAQAYEVSRRPGGMIDGRSGYDDKTIDAMSQYAPVMTQGSVGNVYAEDLSVNTHMITGYTTTALSPTAGNIAWSSVHIVYGGTDYAIADGNTSSSAIYYLWFQISSATGTAPNKTAVMQQSTLALKPPLATGDAIVFLNNNGQPISVLESNIPRVLADNAVDTNALQGTAVTAAKIANNTITTTQISTTAGITGTQIATNANLAGTQLAASANIAGTQIASNAGLVGGQLANNTITATQLGQGAVTASRLSILEHVLY